MLKNSESTARVVPFCGTPTACHPDPPVPFSNIEVPTGPESPDLRALTDELNGDLRSAIAAGGVDDGVPRFLPRPLDDDGHNLANLLDQSPGDRHARGRVDLIHHHLRYWSRTDRLRPNRGNSPQPRLN